MVTINGLINEVIEYALVKLGPNYNMVFVQRWSL